MDDRDTIDAAAVDPSEQLDVDEGEGANALRDVDTPDLPPDDTLADVYDDPGDVVGEDLG